MDWSGVAFYSASLRCQPMVLLVFFAGKKSEKRLVKLTE